MVSEAYRPKLPITSVRVEKKGSHLEVVIWVNHGLSGRLIVHDNEVLSLLMLLFNIEGEQVVVIGGDEGSWVTVHCASKAREALSPNDQLLIMDDSKGTWAITTVGAIENGNEPSLAKL